MPSLERNIVVIERLEKKLFRSFEEIQEEIFQMVDRLTRRFKTVDGYYVPDPDTEALLARLNKAISKIIRDSHISDELINWIDDFDQIDKNIKALQSSLNGIKVSGEIFTQQKAWAIDNTVNSLVSGNLDSKFINPVKQLLYSRVAYGGSVVDAERQLRTLILGEGKNPGVLERSIGQVARDTINQYQGTINQQIKVQYELTNIRYVGPLVRDSREQCIRWINKFDGFIRDDQLEDEIRWAYNNGSGMMPDTIPENFCQKRGGYNCIHEAIPVRKRN
jgi:hypothetical protein